MTGFKDSTETWARAWLDAQKQYMDTWMQMTQAGKSWPGTQHPPFDWGGVGAWADPMQQWTRLMTQALPQDSQETSTRLFGLGKSYMNMGETFWRLLQQGKDFTGQQTEWLEAMKNAFSSMCSGADTAGKETDPWSGFATFWGLPLNTWERFACAFSPLPGALEKALRPEGGAVPSDMTRAIRQVLSMPPVGYTREWQEQAQEWAQLYMEYARAMQEFAQLLGKVSQRAGELFGQRLTDLFKEGKPLDGLRAAYNLWIDCGEEAYAEVMGTPDFPHLQAQMVNALMRLKRHEQAMLDEVMTAMNMPTRRELDTTHQRVHGLQQQLGALQDAMENVTSAEQQAPEKPRAAARAPAAARRSAPAKKKAAVKPASNPGQTRRRVQPKKTRGKS
jgi:class III poly(R)-hydroxyalkanoic acid synthase PhaE subunit